MGDTLFKTSGILLVISGATGLFYAILCMTGLFTAPIVPSFRMVLDANGADILGYALVAIISLVLNIGLIFVGLIVARLHELRKGSENAVILEEKINRLQNITWRMFQHLKKRHQPQ